MIANVILEGLVFCFIMLLSCAAGIANGPVNMVFFYEKEVQDRVVELGLTTPEQIRQGAGRFFRFALLPSLLFILIAVYGINGARGFREGFLQILGILLIEGLFDRLFIDWWWVNHTKAWIIPGTEDLTPYIYGKPLIRKWLGTLIGYPLLAALLAGVMALIFH